MTTQNFLVKEYGETGRAISAAKSLNHGIIQDKPKYNLSCLRSTLMTSCT